MSTTLFIMYVNDLLPNVPNTEIVAFADDNTLIMAAPDVKTLATLAQSEFPAVTHYMYDNRLALHPTKTKYMLLRRATYPRFHCKSAERPLPRQPRSGRWESSYKQDLSTLHQWGSASKACIL